MKSDLNDDLKVDGGQLDDSRNDFGDKDISVATKRVSTYQNSQQLDLDQSTEKPTLDKMPILVLALIRKKLVPEHIGAETSSKLANHSGQHSSSTTTCSNQLVAGDHKCKTNKWRLKLTKRIKSNPNKLQSLTKG